MTESTTGTVTLHGEFGKMHQSGERPNNFTIVPLVNKQAISSHLFVLRQCPTRCFPEVEACESVESSLLKHRLLLILDIFNDSR